MRFRYLSLSIAAIALAIFSITVLGATKLPAPKSSIQPIDQIVAIVNDGIITQSEIDSAYQRAVKHITKSGRPIPDASTLKNQILNQLIYRKLQLQLAKRYGFKITKKQIDNAIKSITKQHKITITQLKRKVKADGFTYPQYRKEIELQIMVTMVQHQALGKSLHVSDAEVNQFLTKYKTQGKFATQYHLMDLLIPLPAGSTSTQAKQAKAEAYKIIRKLSKGIDVHKIAGVQVTDMGWRTTTSLPDLFTRQIVKAKVGSVIGPLRAQNGYHIVKLTGIRKSSASLPNKDQVRQLLLQRKLGKSLQKWLTKLRKKASVRILTPQ